MRFVLENIANGAVIENCKKYPGFLLYKIPVTSLSSAVGRAYLCSLNS